MFALAFLAAIVPLAGEVLVYQRTNTDGSEAERVVVHDRAPGEVWVHKSREPCTDAAFVIGRADPDTGQALKLVGGRLRRDLGQDPTAWLTYEDGVILARIGSPEATPAFTLPAARRWVLYDFDFSDLIAHPPAEIAAGEDFSFDLPLFLVGEGQPVFANLGRLTMSFAGSAGEGSQAYSHYIASGTPLGDRKGRFWFGPDGRLIDAIMPIPNHSEYRDFRLRLTGRTSGRGAWSDAVGAHWAGCPIPQE